MEIRPQTFLRDIWKLSITAGHGRKGLDTDETRTCRSSGLRTICLLLNITEGTSPHLFLLFVESKFAFQELLTSSQLSLSLSTLSLFTLIQDFISSMKG